jgi:hypothetical protein
MNTDSTPQEELARSADSETEHMPDWFFETRAWFEQSDLPGY